MTERIRRPVRLFAPAKVNLGLEVTGKRPDGYHDLVTVLEAISIFDVIDVLPAESSRVITTSGVPENENLVTRALTEAENLAGTGRGYQIRIHKHIPEAAGLGGGSSDAGTVLAWLGDTHGLDPEDVHAVAGGLGSDVPYFLDRGPALARGTGTEISRFSTPKRRWYVVVTLDLEIPGKTGALYRQLTEEDFTDGSATEHVGERLASGDGVESLPLRNTFLRPLFEYDAVRNTDEFLRDAGARQVLPSGAGPAMFAVFDTYQTANAVARRLPSGCGAVNVATSVFHAPRLGRIT